MNVCLPRLSHSRFAALMLFLFSATCQASYVSTVAADSPIHWWRFEDAASTTGSVALDSAGSGNGTYNGNIVFQPGIAGQAARFDGSLDSVSMGNLGALPVQGSIELWIYPEAMQNHRNPFTTGPLGATSTGNRAIRFEAKDTGTLQAYIGDDSATTQPQFSTPLATNVSSMSWHHVVLTWNSTAGTVNAFFDGGPAFSLSNSYFPSTMSDVRVGMGWANLAERSWLGRVDEVAIYDYQLDAARVSQHFSAAVPAPAALWLFGSGFAGLVAVGRRRSLS